MYEITLLTVQLVSHYVHSRRFYNYIVKWSSDRISLDWKLYTTFTVVVTGGVERNGKIQRNIGNFDTSYDPPTIETFRT